MSATRGAHPKRPEHDFYETPAWATESIVPFLKFLMPEPNRILDPGAGTGAITRVISKAYPTTKITLIEIQQELIEEAVRRKPQEISASWIMHQGNFLEMELEHEFDLCIGNPPYRGPAGEDYAMMFVKKAMQVSKVVCFLLRLNWLGSQKRARWFLEQPSNKPHLKILAKRPSYDQRGTDATESAWMIWARKDVHAGLSGSWNVLPAPGNEEQQMMPLIPTIDSV